MEVSGHLTAPASLPLGKESPVPIAYLIKKVQQLFMPKGRTREGFENKIQERIFGSER
jgi:hypothetical protein